jgi:hypothetical protein
VNTTIQFLTVSYSTLRNNSCNTLTFCCNVSQSQDPTNCYINQDDLESKRRNVQPLRVQPPLPPRPPMTLHEEEWYVLGVGHCLLNSKTISLMFTACLPQHSQNPTRTNRSSGLIRNSYLLNKQMIIDNQGVSRRKSLAGVNIMSMREYARGGVSDITSSKL